MSLFTVVLKGSKSAVTMSPTQVPGFGTFDQEMLQIENAVAHSKQNIHHRKYRERDATMRSAVLDAFRSFHVRFVLIDRDRQMVRVRRRTPPFFTSLNC
jgi:hypothetical protein